MRRRCCVISSDCCGARFRWRHCLSLRLLRRLRVLRTVAGTAMKAAAVATTGALAVVVKAVGMAVAVAVEAKFVVIARHMRRAIVMDNARRRVGRVPIRDSVPARVNVLTGVAKARAITPRATVVQAVVAAVPPAKVRVSAKGSILDVLAPALSAVAPPGPAPVSRDRAARVLTNPNGTHPSLSG